MLYQLVIIQIKMFICQFITNNINADILLKINNNGDEQLYFLSYKRKLQHLTLF